MGVLRPVPARRVVDLNAMAAPVADRNLKALVADDEDGEGEDGAAPVAAPGYPHDENPRRDMGQVSAWESEGERERPTSKKGRKEGQPPSAGCMACATTAAGARVQQGARRARGNQEAKDAT